MSSLLYAYVGSPVGNGADTTADVVISYTLPPNTLELDGQSVRITLTGEAQAIADARVVSVALNGVPEVSMTLAPNATIWRLQTELVRNGNTDLQPTKLGFDNAPTTHLQKSSPRAFSGDWTQPVVITITCQDTMNPVADALDVSNCLIELLD
jgi:hypothetical protein